LLLVRYKNNLQMNIKKIFLVRHADFTNQKKGSKQVQQLANSIKKELVNGEVTIWSSSAKRANTTAQIIKEELQRGDIFIEEQLYSDAHCKPDYQWLRNKIQNHRGDNLIIVSHLEYVRYFPNEIGFGKNCALDGEGVVITNNTYLELI